MLTGVEEGGIVGSVSVEERTSAAQIAAAVPFVKVGKREGGEMSD